MNSKASPGAIRIRGLFIRLLSYLCGGKPDVHSRIDSQVKTALDAGFAAAFEGSPARYFSAPGRTEIGGNHTDHQRGRGLAAAVNLDTVAAVRVNGTNIIRIQSKGYPMSVVDPHADKHHIKKENIGLIEVMGLAVLPSRLKKELHDLADAIVAGRNIAADEVLSNHAPWVEELKKQDTFTEDNALDIILQETGKVFAGVLEDAGVYKNTPEGKAAFQKFVDYVNQEA